jgi:serine/threonine protein kinase
VIIKKLGWGHFSTVWMVKDRKLQVKGNLVATSSSTSSRNFLALKVQKSAEHYTEAAMDEVELLDCIANERKACEAELRGPKEGLKKDTIQLVDHSKYIATLHDHFFHSGPNGKHMCMVFSMLGCNLLSVIKAHNYRGIPVKVVKQMIRGCCKGLDFLHRRCKIIHTDLKPENVLLQFPHQIDSDEDDMLNNLNLGVQAALGLERSSDHGRRNSLGQSIIDLEVALDDPQLPSAQKKRLKKKLKKKRQKERKRTFTKNSESSDEEDDPVDAAVTRAAEVATPIDLTPSLLCDFEMGKMLSNAANLMNPQSPTDAAASQHVKRRLGHSSFVTCNFGPRCLEADSKLTEILRENVSVSQARASEVRSKLDKMEASSGVAQICILLRCYNSEEELAKGLSSALGGVPPVVDVTSRDWHLELTLPAAKIPESLRQASFSDFSTYIHLSQRLRNGLGDDFKQSLAGIASGIAGNLTDKSSSHEANGGTSSSSSGSSSGLVPSSVFTLRFPVVSTFVVLSFLESRLPGLAFFTYKRNDGRPKIDSCIFGSMWQSVCSHPLAMRVRGSADSKCSKASAIFGFDLRLVKDFGAAKESDEHGNLSFSIGSEKVANWWEARNSIRDRVEAFTGIDPSVDMVNLVGNDDEREMVPEKDVDFKEGGKAASDVSTAPSSRDTSASSAARSPSAQIDLKDTDMLLNCRSVIVDLGNACWTHRHFSEDIQTRQYRAPEVLIGSKYDTSADIWSLGCMTFELLTGDLLFDPRAGDDYDRDEDHLAMFQELLGKMPKRIALEGKYAKNFFDKRGTLKHIKQLKFWPVQDVLTEKYHFPPEEAKEIAKFMTPLLDFDPKTRATALEALHSDWLRKG